MWFWVLRVQIPLSTPKRPRTLIYASVAQLDRAPDFESVGRRFESCRAYILEHGPLAQLGEQQTLNLRVEGSIPSRLTKADQIERVDHLFDLCIITARVVKLVDTLDLGSSAVAA